MGEKLSTLYSKVSFAERSHYRRKVLHALCAGDVLTPTELSGKTDCTLSNVSRALSELKGRSLVKCLNPDDTKTVTIKLQTLVKKLTVR